MIRCLLVGTLFADPQARVSANGKSYATARLRADNKDNESTWVSVIAFGEQAERLLTLKPGAAISVSGRAKLSSWLGKDGSPSAGLDLTIDELATLRGKPRPRDAAQPDRRPPAAAGFDDELPSF